MGNYLFEFFTAEHKGRKTFFNQHSLVHRHDELKIPGRTTGEVVVVHNYYFFYEDKTEDHHFFFPGAGGLLDTTEQLSMLVETYGIIYEDDIHQTMLDLLLLQNSCLKITIKLNLFEGDKNCNKTPGGTQLPCF